MISSVAYAQPSSEYTITSTDENNNWLRITNGGSVDPAEILNEVAAYYDLDELVSFQLDRQNVDKLGFSHYRYDQYFDGVKVQGGQLFLHISSDGEIKVNSRLAKEITATGQGVIDESLALQNALSFIDAPSYFWEDAEMELLLKEMKNDNSATFYPSGELVYANKNRRGGKEDYTLNWSFEIYAKGEMQRTFVFVDALSGDISFTLDGIHTDASNGVAHTRYHGIRDIITDSTGSSNDDFVLYDDTRGGGVITLDMQEGFEYDDAVNFTDEDNIWDNANAQLDDAAGDAHWGMEMTYDYFLQVHGQNSYDNQGSEVRSYIHYDVNYFNAFWNGLFMTFGDGGNNPLTSIDVVGHEFSHGLTGNSAGLIYQAESGALNESFSDIFGTAIEFWALEDSLSSWNVGVTNFQLRNMSDPNDYGHPDTYEGDNWVDITDLDFDNGGVHINSGVQNYWFYLLSEGGSGVNDNGAAYDVDGIGIEAAEEIAFRNLIVYLGNQSTYEDAYEGSVEAASDLYGACSEEVRQVLKAWYAVGIGVSDLSKDVAVKGVTLPESSCYLSANETAEIMIKYQNVGCNEVLPSGSTITVGYRINDEALITEEIILTQDLESGDTIYHTFDGSVDMSAFGKYYIDFFAGIDEDLISFNDTVFNQEVLHQVQLASDDVVGFESLTFSPDSFYVEIGENAEARISTAADNTGSRGFKMSGYDVDADILELPTDEEDNFTFNPEYNGKVCFCVDASEWNNARLAFDMKQFFSLYWEELYGDNMSEFVSSMRILVNGEQVGDQYHPTTETDDPYLTYYVNLDEYAGTTFEACFETKAYIRNAEDPMPGSNGDNTYLDNVRFMDNSALGVDDIDNSKFAVYPNPTKGLITIEVKEISESFTISIIDALGKVMHFQNEVNGTNSYQVDMSSFTKGIYIVRIQTENEFLSRRVILQ
jgi:Zn-dependent metalloprotease